MENLQNSFSKVFLPPLNKDYVCMHVSCINSVPERRNNAIEGINLGYIYYTLRNGCENKIADLWLFGRLADARRARPRCLRLFNAHFDEYLSQNDASQDSALVETQ